MAAGTAPLGAQHRRYTLHSATAFNCCPNPHTRSLLLRLVFICLQDPDAGAQPRESQLATDMAALLADWEAADAAWQRPRTEFMRLVVQGADEIMARWDALIMNMRVS